MRYLSGGLFAAVNIGRQTLLRLLGGGARGWGLFSIYLCAKDALFGFLAGGGKG